MPGNWMARVLTLRASMPIVRVGNKTDDRSTWGQGAGKWPNSDISLSASHLTHQARPV